MRVQEGLGGLSMGLSGLKRVPKIEGQEGVKRIQGVESQEELKGFKGLKVRRGFDKFSSIYFNKVTNMILKFGKLLTSLGTF